MIMLEVEDYIKLDGLGLAQLIQSGEISAREAAEAAITTIEEHNPDINAVIELYSERALINTHQLPKGKFSGVPFLVKDVGPTERGQLIEMGSQLAKGVTADDETPLMSSYK